MSPDSIEKATPIINFKDVSFSYPRLTENHPTEWALDCLNLKIEPGKISALMGPTGAGKSTLALAMLGVVPQSTGGRIRGSITVCGLDPIRTPIPQMAQHVGLVFQDPENQFLASSVAEEVAFGLESLGVPSTEIPGRILSALKQVGMEELLDRSPFQLSGGQKQRVAIASILAMRPEILILDEASTSLDPPGAAELLQVLETLRRETAATIVFISNQTDWVSQLADQVFIMAEGKVQVQGAPSEILADVESLRQFGLRPPELSALSYELTMALDRNVNFSSWDHARRQLASLLSSRST